MWYVVPRSDAVPFGQTSAALRAGLQPARRRRVAGLAGSCAGLCGFASSSFRDERRSGGGVRTCAAEGTDPDVGNWLVASALERNPGAPQACNSPRRAG